VISCIDSRTSPDLIFDSGIGDIISIRIAGNIITREIAGSVELACREIGVRLVVVLGHSNCGAITQALTGNNLGNLKWIMKEIEPAILQSNVTEPEPFRDFSIINQVSMLNLRHSVKKLKNFSSFLSEEIQKGEIGLVAGFYDTNTGKVTFDQLEFSGKMKEAQVISNLTPQLG
jgi:carbonic anhydrase/SulP family sulfate permease